MDVERDVGCIRAAGAGGKIAQEQAHALHGAWNPEVLLVRVKLCMFQRMQLLQHRDASA
jgi:hypothetical protein